MNYFVLVTLVLGNPGNIRPLSLPLERPLSAKDRAYLRGIERDTWRCIASMVHGKTGLPYDNASHGEWTSVSNIGLYLTSVTVAQAMGLITPEAAAKRVDSALSSLEKFKTWFGFQQSWYSVESLAPAKHDPWISALDSGNLAGSLVVVAQSSPRFSGRCLALFHAMEWDRFYDRSQQVLVGGYNTITGEMNPKWHLDLLGSDAMLAQFFAVARGHAPAALLDKLARDTETTEGITYLKPGWKGGGLFMQYISGIWLDLKNTEMGNSADNFAYAQIRHAKAIGSPVWGWSASDSPKDGYLGWGHLKDEVVTCHACALAISRFPQEAVANLRALEALGGRSAEQGFFDAVDWKAKAHTNNFLMLDQSMLFLSIASYLEGNIVCKNFQESGEVRRAMRSINVFAIPN